ncbi:MAG TPA: hypothetical protein VH209_09110 [Steroidobacteraceae bacterium]|jgi:hypothetical protein|nr:hypothetical protein [Steroidobacteraceae bacterium]
MLASLREEIAHELASQPLTSTEAAVEVASAHLFEQSRRLGMELVNRHQAAKGAGLI